MTPSANAGNLRRDQALLADAKLDLKRYEGLVKEDSIASSSSTPSGLVDQYKGPSNRTKARVKTRA